MAGHDHKAAATQPTDIAIIGMAAHLPGAPDVATYWQNLRAGIESITDLSRETLLAAGESASRLARPNYVARAALLEGFDAFDAEFFGFSPKEAAILDPQHRNFLEVAWEALEHAGWPPESIHGAVGVWAGCGQGTYYWQNILSNRDLVAETGTFLLRHTGNDKDFLATRVSHVLDLKGPSVNVQTACSTSLVAVHQAVQALLAGECDMALAGGVTIELPQLRGYLHEAGEILSPDGHCHAFDHRAEGTVFGSGAGCVVLKRADQALRDGDHIWALIKGSAINNDGAAKAGYLAPSVDGQAACVAEAQAMAGVGSDSVGYIECHGTGTRLGDPIEVAALTQAFRESGSGIGHCRIGSVKTNIGHLDTAAGVAGLIKVALALHHREIPASLGYEAPNPAIDFETSPFRVNDRLSAWQGHAPRRAGVNSLGVGGTNAHVVMEEAPVQPATAPSDWPFQPLVISARSKAALDAQALRLAAHLRAHPEQDLADVAFTLKEGRRAFEKRRVIVAASHAEAADLLEGKEPRRVFNHDLIGASPEAIFMFPGGGAQYAGMARDLYETEPVFRDWMDEGLRHLEADGAEDIRALWLPAAGDEAAAEHALRQPSRQLPLILITEIALARLFESWGVRPGALIGHSMGENAAAVLAGVLSFQDGIRLVHLRGQLFDTVPRGGMLSVPLAAEALEPELGPDLDMASVNAPGLCVVSGPDEALRDLARRLATREIETTRIAIDIAAHSRMLEPILERFHAFVASLPLQAPQLPIISNRTGLPLSAAEATSPEYWTAHLRGTVLFEAGIAHLVEHHPRAVFIEMGPGRAMSSLAQANGVAPARVVPALRHPDQQIEDDAWHLGAIARLWACGLPLDWAPIWGGARRRRVPLPGYAFQKKPWFIAPAAPEAEAAPSDAIRHDDIADWGWVNRWQPLDSGVVIGDLAGRPPGTWALFDDGGAIMAAAAAQLLAHGQRVLRIRAGDRFARLGPDSWSVSPEAGLPDLEALIAAFAAEGLRPDHVLHGWLADPQARLRPGASRFQRNVDHGFWSLVHLLQALGAEGQGALSLVVLTQGAQRLGDEALVMPEAALIEGPLRVASREFPGTVVGALDLRGAEAAPEVPAARLIEEAMAATGTTAALRGGRRLQREIAKAPLPETGLAFPMGAHVLITGGFGGIGLTLAEALIRRHQARITLIARAVPQPGQRRALALARLAECAATHGGAVQVCAGDVTNPAEMRAAREAAETAFGPVHTLIHAAGMVDDGPLLGREDARMAAVLAPKVLGTEVLAATFPDGTLAQMLLLASSSTRTGPAGQVDYVAANAFLNAFAQARRGGKTRVVALNWGIWQGVGMAAESLAETRQPLDLPLLHEAHGTRQLHGMLSAEHWLFDGHRTAAGEALLPGTGHLELLSQAARALGLGTRFEIRDLTFLAPLDLRDGESRALRLVLTPEAAGHAVSIETALAGGWLPHASAWLGAETGARPVALDPKVIASRLAQPERGQGLPLAQEAHLRFGPRWRVLSARAFGPGEGLAELALPAAFAAEPAAGWHLHPALLDIATGWAMELIAGYRAEHLWVPLTYARVRIFAPLPARILSHVRARGALDAAQATAGFDITLMTPEGDVLAEIEGFTIRRLETGLRLAPPDPRQIRRDGAATRSPAEERLRHMLAQGIRPEEGAEAFFRALALDQPEVVVSSLDLAQLMAIADAEARAPEARGSAASFARPDLASEFVAARTEVEARLTGFWQELLGVSEVGIDDDFFDLGGHSLIAVRLFAMVRKAWGLDLPISVLFEAPTIRACASLIEAEIGPSAALGGEQGDSAAAPARVKAPVRRFTHLVPMHAGTPGPGRPFFLVAGMFGNVLNLRQLAGLLGQDRPVWGLQARGLYGDAPPHADFPSAAQDYLAEMREVQAEGPWLLGGFSGGGLIAWEIARQLEAGGEAVAQLALLDTPLPMRPGLSRRDKALIKLALLREEGPGYLARWWRERRAWMREGRFAVAENAEGGLQNAAIEAAFRAALPLHAMHERAGATTLYRPPLDRRFRVSGGHFVSEAREYVFDDNDLTRFAPRLEVVEVPGDHDSMVLEPNVRVLAAELRRRLKAADGIASLARAAE